MPGRKDKKSGDRKKRSQGGGGADSMAAMFGFPMPTEDDADLEAELMALEGKAPKKGGKSKSGKGGAFSMADVDSMLAGIGDIGEGDDDNEDMSDIDDEDLLGELQALQGDDDDEPTEAEPEPPSRPQPSQLAPQPAPRKPPTSGGGSTSPLKGASGGGGGGDVQVVSDRLELYKQALKQAEGTGEGAKARRYKRSIASLEQSLKSARAGKPVNVDDLPPVVSIKAAPPASQTPQPQTPPTTTTAAMAIKPRPVPAPVPKPRPPPQQQPEVKTGNLIDLSGPEFDEFNLTDEELEAMATAMVDDRKSQPPPSQTPPKIAPPTKTTPTSQPLTRQPLSSVAAKPGPSPVPIPALVSVPAPAPKPKPRPPAQAKPPPTLPSGMIDLDAEEFDEFNLSDEDLAAMASMLVDDRAKKPRLEEEEKEIPMDTSKAPPVVPSRPAPQKPTSSISSTSSSSSIKPSTQSLPAKLTAPPASDRDKGMLKALLEERREQYLNASKAQKDAAKTKEYRVMAAQFGRVLKAFEQGQEVDLSQMPGPPPGYFSKYNVDVSKFKPAPRPPPSQAIASSPLASVGGGGATGGQSSAAAAAEDEDVVNPDIPVPRTPLEALQQRLAKYKEGQKSAQEKGESSRVRRMGRIIKQYEDAIKLTKAGKPCDYDELPTPPGFPPIPSAPIGAAARAPVRQVKPGVAAVAAPTQSLPVGGPAKPKQLPSRIVPSLSQEQQALVEQRRSELLTAARQAQAKNDKASAVHYLKLRKGLDTMLEASKSGLPVNLEEIPPSPFADVTKTKPAAAVLSHLKPASEGDAATFDLIEKQLETQVKICDENAETYEKMGSTASSIQYQNMSQNCQRELLALKGIRLQGLAPPKFTMETRKFVIVHSHSEISSQVCEIEVVSASNLPRPSGYEEKDMNVYVEVEFPWPSEEPPKMSTNQVRDTCSPEFSDQIFKFDVDRKKLKSMQRVFKRTPVKCVVWQKRTLRKDIFIGQGMLSLEILDKKCEHRATVDLMDEKGRKATGGKLTVEARLREPLTGRDEEEREEQWLVFHEAIAAKSSVTMPKPKVSPQKGAQGGSGVNFAALSPVKVESTTSLEALRVEYSLVQSAVKAGHKDAATIQRGKQIHARMEAIKQRLQSDPQFRQGFAKQVAKEMHNEQLLETQLAKQGKAKQAEVVILQKRRAAMEKELKAMQGRKM